MQRGGNLPEKKIHSYHFTVVTFWLGRRGCCRGEGDLFAAKQENRASTSCDCLLLKSGSPCRAWTWSFWGNCLRGGPPISPLGPRSPAWQCGSQGNLKPAIEFCCGIFTQAWEPPTWEPADPATWQRGQLGSHYHPQALQASMPAGLVPVSQPCPVPSSGPTRLPSKVGGEIRKANFQNVK